MTGQTAGNTPGGRGCPCGLSDWLPVRRDKMKTAGFTAKSQTEVSNATD